MGWRAQPIKLERSLQIIYAINAGLQIAPINPQQARSDLGPWILHDQTLLLATASRVYAIKAQERLLRATYSGPDLVHGLSREF